MSRIIECRVNDEYILGSGVPIGAAGSHGDVALRLIFNEMWDGLNIIATFIDSLAENSSIIELIPSMLEEGEVRTYLIPIPGGAKKYAGRVKLTLSGYSVYAVEENGTRIYKKDSLTNTTTAFFRVLESDTAIIDDDDSEATYREVVLGELNAFNKRMEEFEEDMTDFADEINAAENGYIDENGSFINGRVQNEEARIEAEEDRKKFYDESFIGRKGGAEGAGYFNTYDGAIHKNRADAKTSTVFGYNNRILADHSEWHPDEFMPIEKSSPGMQGFLAGGNNVLTGYSSAGIGEQLEVVGYRAIAMGYFLKAFSGRQFVCGVCNEPDIPEGNDPDKKGKYAFIVGGGTTSKRKNIFAVAWNGDIVLSNGKTLKELIEDKVTEQIGNIDMALDELHNYAQALIGGGTV